MRERLVTRLSLLRQQDAPYVLLVSPLLFESGQVDMVQRTLVVDVPEALQIERTTQRDDVDLALKDAFETVFESRLVRAPDPIREPA